MSFLPDNFGVADCGHGYCGPSQGKSGGTGYAVLTHMGFFGYPKKLLRPDNTICYDCATELARSEVAVEDSIGAYLSSDGRHVTTWTGGELMHVRASSYRSSEQFTPSGGRHTVTTFRAVDADGHEWFGRGAGRGMYARLRITAASKRKRDAA